MIRPPYIVGGLAMAWGFVKSALTGAGQQSDQKLIQFIKKYQRRALIVGKKKAIEEINDRKKTLWTRSHD